MTDALVEANRHAVDHLGKDPMLAAQEAFKLCFQVERELGKAKNEIKRLEGLLRKNGGVVEKAFVIVPELPEGVKKLEEMFLTE